LTLAGRLGPAVAVAAVACALAAFAAGPAPAAVPPTPEQLAELTAAAAFPTFYEIPGEAAVLSDARVSTVDPTWAAAEVVYPALHRAARSLTGGRHDLLQEPPPSEGLAIFHQEASGRWFTVEPPSRFCDAGWPYPIPDAVAEDLTLPNCGIGVAKLGEPVSLVVAGGARKTEPRSVLLEFPKLRVRISDIHWYEPWTVNRRARAVGTGLPRVRECDRSRCGPARRGKRVELTLDGYSNCGGRLAFTEAVVSGIVVHGRRGRHRRLLPCPQTPAGPAPAPPTSG
jgi:hypothetical protein